jgi:hypothetical protein
MLLRNLLKSRCHTQKFIKPIIVLDEMETIFHIEPRSELYYTEKKQNKI